MHHAEGLAAEFLNTADHYGMITEGDRILVALSGGADSTALVVLLASLSNQLGIQVFAAHLNHCLRGEASDSDEQFVHLLCCQLNVPLQVSRKNIAEAAKADCTGIEEAARTYRYQFLQRAAEQWGCTKIATAHNANDNAETVLMNLIRGSGARGLGGIPPVRGNIIRPLLRSSRAAIESYLKEKGVGYVTDQTNFDQSILRNRIRHQVIPVLLEVNPSLLERICDTTELLRADEDYLNTLAGELVLNQTDPPAISRKELARLPEALAGRVVRRMYSSLSHRRSSNESFSGNDSGRTLSKQHVDSILNLASRPAPSGEVYLPNGIHASCVYDMLILKHREKVSPQEKVPLVLGKQRFGEWTIHAELCYDSWRETDKNTVFLAPDLIHEGLLLRKARPGDTLSPADRPWTKTLKKLYIEQKIPREERAYRPVLAVPRGVCAIPGFSADKAFAARTPPALRISFQQNDSCDVLY